jgi:hypothetical protein
MHAWEFIIFYFEISFGFFTIYYFLTVLDCEYDECTVFPYSVRHWFPRVAIKKVLGSLKQGKHIISQFWRPDV